MTNSLWRSMGQADRAEHRPQGHLENAEPPAHLCNRLPSPLSLWLTSYFNITLAGQSLELRPIAQCASWGLREPGPACLSIYMWSGRGAQRVGCSCMAPHHPLPLYRPALPTPA